VLVDGSDPVARIAPNKPETWGPAHWWCPLCKLPFVKGRVRELKPNERPFAQGDRVLVQGENGEVVGEVMHAATPHEMPHLGQGSSSHEAHQVMHEGLVDFLVLIKHPHDEGDLFFFALRHPGGWRDLQGQELQITKVRSAN
jgi:hypothetical protein